MDLVDEVGFSRESGVSMGLHAVAAIAALKMDWVDEVDLVD